MMIYSVSTPSGPDRKKVIDHIPQNTEYVATNLMKVMNNYIIIYSEIPWPELRSHFEEVGAIVSLKRIKE